MIEDILRSPGGCESTYNPHTIYLNYASRFIQRLPHCNVKTDTGWYPAGPFTDDKVMEHNDGIKVYGTFAQHYSQYAILDIDGHKRARTYADVENVHKVFGLDSDNSITYETSPGSCHTIFKPQYNGKPVSVNLVQLICKDVLRTQKDVELFPKFSHVIRAPFPPACPITHRDPSLPVLDSLERKMMAYDGLDFVDMKSYKPMIRTTPTSAPVIPKPTKGVMKEGQDLFEYGMQADSESRFFSTRKVVQYLWHRNTPPELNNVLAYTWVLERTNGYSKSAEIINGGGRDSYREIAQVQKEIASMVEHVYADFEKYAILPASAHNCHYGYLTEADMVTVAQNCGGNIPLFKYLCNVLAYFNVRGKMRLNVHHAKLQDFCSRPGSQHHKNNYFKHTERVEQLGLWTREHNFRPDGFSKAIQLSDQLRPSFKSFEDVAVLKDNLGQALTLDECIEEVGRKNVYQMLTQNGVAKPNACRFLNDRGL